MPDDDRVDRVGDLARAAGVAACVCLLVPVIGDVVTVPVGVLAVVLGFWGVHRFDEGRAVSPAPAVLGAVLGMVAVLGAVLVWLASGPA